MPINQRKRDDERLLASLQSQIPSGLLDQINEVKARVDRRADALSFNTDGIEGLDSDTVVDAVASMVKTHARRFPATQSALTLSLLDLFKRGKTTYTP